MTDRIIGHYRLLERLGQGAGGAVYRAEDTRLSRVVALKLLRAEALGDPDLRRRFMQEAQAASSLQHPHLCTIHDLGETDDGQLYIAMSYYGGGSLADRLAGGVLAPGDSARIAGEVAAGLAHAHAAGIVHRDLKPANIMFDAGGRAVVVDFGLARLVDAETVTRDGTLLGTLMYMSPEQVRGEPAGPPSDVWSLGVVLYEMLSGEKPFQGPSAAAVLAAITEREPDLPAVASEPDQGPLASVLRGCLQKDPRQRQHDAAGIRDLLRPVSSGVNASSAQDARTVVLPSSGVGRRRPQRRWTVLVVALALAILVGAMGSQLGWFGARTAPGIVLLPPVAVGGDDRDQALADGLVQMLASSLNVLEVDEDRPWVAPAMDVRFREVTGVETAQGRLGAGVAVAATLHRQGDLLRLELVRHETLPRSWPQVSGPPESRSIPGSRGDLVGWLGDVRAGLLDLLDWPGAGAELPGRGETRIAAALETYLVGLGLAWPFGGVPDRAGAIESFEAAIAADHGFAMAHAALAAALRDGDDLAALDLAASLAAADRAVAAAPDLYEAHLQRGMTLRALQDPGAIDAFRRADHLLPGHAVTVSRLGEQLVIAGQITAADSVFTVAVERRPTYVTARAYRGRFLMEEGRFEDAAREFRRAVDLAPTFAPGLSNLGTAFLYLDRLDEAEAMFLRAAALAPDAIVYQNLGTVYFIEQHYLDAAGMYEKSLELEPGNSDVWGWVGECYFWSGADADRAQMCFRRAATLADAELVLAGNDLALLISRASYAAFGGDEEQARPLLARFLAADSADPYLWFQAAVVQELLAEREGALDSLERALGEGLPVEEITRYPGFDRLRSSPRYAEMLASAMGPDGR